MGPAVNLASRVEGAVKQLGVSIVITGSTRELLPESYATRRLCSARLLGVANPVELYELHGEQCSEQWCEFRDTYEAALTHFEERRWEEACQSIYPLLSHQHWRFDVPSLNLLSQAVECLRTPPTDFDPTVVFTQK